MEQPKNQPGQQTRVVPLETSLSDTEKHSYIVPWQERLDRIKHFTILILKGIDSIGRFLIGDLWETLYLSVQDAIALSLLLTIPGWIGHLLLGQEFSGFKICAEESSLSVNQLACYVIVSSDFLLWILLSGRIIGRFIKDFKNLFKSNAANQ